MKTLKVPPGLVSRACLGLLALSGLLATPGNAADHRDAPGIAEDGRADILDVYSFVNPNNGNVVLAMTVNPFTIGGAVQVAFSPDVLYQFKIDNNGDYKEDLVIQATFTPTVPGPQRVTITGPSRPRVVPELAAGIGSRNLLLPASSPHFSGPANGTVIDGTNGTSAVKGFAGLRDDPFFIDLIWVLRLLGLQPGGAITTRTGGIDFFAGLNCSIVAIELPPALLKGRTSNNVIHVWGTTSRRRVTSRSDRATAKDSQGGVYVQVDRMALPVLNTVLMPPALKDEFNRAVPSQDRALFRNAAIASLDAVAALVGVSNSDSGALADALLPDVLTLDVTSIEQYLNGFFNGRRPETDVADTVLSVASRGQVTTDNVNANDVPFLSDFPFFAPPHAPSENIPPRN